MALIEVKIDNAHYWVDENGAWQGEYKEWYDNGQLWEDCHYMNDELHGEYKEWYENGQLANHCHFVNGNRHGECKVWYENGQIWVHSVYVNDEHFDVDPSKLSDKDKFALTLRYGIQWL